MTAPIEQIDIMETVRSYAKFFWLQMSAKGFYIDREEVEGEFGEVFARSMKQFDPAKTTAKFGTYLYAAFANRAATMMTEAAKGWAPRTTLINDEYHGTENAAEGVMAEKDMARKLAGCLGGKNLMVFSELSVPSPAVVARASELKKAGARGVLILAIADVHKISREDIHHAIKAIKVKASKLGDAFVARDFRKPSNSY